MPAVSIQDQSSVVGVELERVSPKVPTLFERDDTFYADIEKRDVEVISSRDMRIPLELRPGGDFGYTDIDGGDLGRGTAPFFDKAVIGAVHMKIGFEWTYQAQVSTNDKRKAVLDSFRHLLSKAMPEFRRQVDAQCMTAGDGVLANPSAVSAGTGTNGGDVWTVPATDGYGVRLLRDGQLVGIYDSTLATKRGEARINFYDVENRIVHTFPAIAGVANTDKLVASGLTTPPVGIFGVPYHHNASTSGTWLGFTRSTTPQIVANRVNAAGALALPFARLAINKIGNRVGKNFLVKAKGYTHDCQKAAYEEIGQMTSIINKANREEGLNLYFGDDMQMAGVPLVTSFAWNKTRIDFVLPEVWGRAELCPPEFYTAEGKKIFVIRGGSGGVATAFIFYIIASFNLFVNNPAACSFIDGLTIPSGY